ncbi:unnamed protein product, partial [Sphacelaria rigidula]
MGTANVDKYGRKVSKKSKQAAKQLRAFYKVEGSDAGDDDDDDDDGESDDDQDDEDDEDGDDDEDEVEDDEILGEDGREDGSGDEDDPNADVQESRQAYLTRLSRGEISELSSSSDEDDDSDGSDSDAEAQADDSDSGDRSRDKVPLSEDTTRRVAVTNCDWDHLRAKDLMVLCNSFCPPSARLRSVTVYSSDFGEKMMKIEAAAGPHAALAES